MKSNEYRYLSLCDGYLEGNELWFSNNNLNALCRENLDSMEIEIIATFHRREKWKKTLHRKIIGYKNFFYLIPNENKEMIPQRIVYSSPMPLGKNITNIYYAKDILTLKKCGAKI